MYTSFSFIISYYLLFDSYQNCVILQYAKIYTTCLDALIYLPI